MEQEKKNEMTAKMILCLDDTHSYLEKLHLIKFLINEFAVKD